MDKSKISASSQEGGFVLGSRRAEKIGAVEGMALTARMRGIFEEARERGLSGDERRALIKRQISKR